MTQAILPFLPPGGRIINIGSVGARAGFAGLGLYCSSKAALEGLARCWAAELGGNGTTVNCVNPGPVESEMLKNIPKEIVEAQKASTPLEKRVGTVEEVAAVVAWLAGGESRWVTGQSLSVSGGWAMYKQTYLRRSQLNEGCIAKNDFIRAAANHLFIPHQKRVKAQSQSHSFPPSG